MRFATLPMELGEVPREAPRGASARRVIPFDYSFVYDLIGSVDKTHSKTIQISIEGPFTAVAISYGLVPRPMPLTFGPGDKSDYPAPPPPSSGGGPTVVFSAPITMGRFASIARAGLLGTSLIARPPQPPKLKNPSTPKRFSELTMDVILHSFRRAVLRSPRFLRGEAGLEALFRNGFRVKRSVLERVLLNDGDVSLEAETLEDLFEVVAAPPDQVPFLYALHDEGSGRAFQSEPIFSVAGLGIWNGDRPFRRFATPILFAPQTTVRLDVTEKSDFEGQLFISLQGFKVLGTPGTPTALRTARR